MVDFAVHHEGMETEGAWVLSVQGERLLLADGVTKALYWRDAVDCTIVKAHTPDQPLAVVPVQVQQPPQAGLVMPEMNRMMRRNGQN